MLSDKKIAECLRATLPRTKCTAGYIAFARAVEHEANARLIEQIKVEAERLDWFFGPASKGNWIGTYMEGVRAGWSAEQWRSAIDVAIRASKGET